MFFFWFFFFFCRNKFDLQEFKIRRSFRDTFYDMKEKSKVKYLVAGSSKIVKCISPNTLSVGGIYNTGGCGGGFARIRSISKNWFVRSSFHRSNYSFSRLLNPDFSL